jgi:hypothetical protein
VPGTSLSNTFLRKSLQQRSLSICLIAYACAWPKNGAETALVVWDFPKRKSRARTFSQLLQLNWKTVFSRAIFGIQPQAIGLFSRVVLIPMAALPDERAIAD